MSSNALKDIPIHDEWYILKGETKYGPFTYTEMIQMMQQKLFFNFDYVWAPHLEQWTTAMDLPDFSTDRLTRLIEKSPEAEKMFNRRRYRRVLLHVDILAHNNLNLWSGRIENLSEGGALAFIGTPLLLPGDIIACHLRGRSKHPDRAFNCTVEIIAKRLTKQRIEHDTGIYYAVRFVHIEEENLNQVRTWVDEQLRLQEELQKNKESKI